MQIKVFKIVGDAVKAAEVRAEEAVNGFLDKNPLLKNIHVAITPDLSTVHGKALVVISYEPHGVVETLKALVDPSPAAPANPTDQAVNADPKPAAPAE